MPHKRERAEDVQSLITSLMEDAVDHYTEELEPDQVLATDYYWGREFGNEQTGRSKVVNPVVRNATAAQMPSLMRIFVGPERVVEFRPRGPEDEALAKQQTEYANFILFEDNDGFLTLNAAFKDALVRRLGVITWWWDEFTRVTATELEGLTQQDLIILEEDDEVELEVLSKSDDPDAEGQELFNVRVIHREDDGRVRVAPIPSEEFVYTPNARNREDAQILAHTRDVAVELVQETTDATDDEIEEAQSEESSTLNDDDSMQDARQFHRGDTRRGRVLDERDHDDSQIPILYTEAYSLVDGDGDGVAELRYFQCIGPKYTIVNGDGMGVIVDEAPFALFTPDPEPHTIVGLSNFDTVGYIQLITSQVERGLLDSMAQAVNKDWEVVQSDVNMQDLLKPDVAKIIRVRKPGSIREITSRFIGNEALAVLDYYKSQQEDNTGTSKASMGLDADAMQSTTKAAVAATISGAQARIEMIARVFAETGMKQLMVGIRGLLIKHQDRKRVVRLRGQYVAVDPRSWEANMDVQINVALGQGTPEDRLAALAQIAADQLELKQAGSPLVSDVEIRNTRARFTEMLGFRNSDEFYRPWGPEQQQQAEQAAAQQPPPPDPAQQLVEVEQMKVQADQIQAQAKLKLEQMKITLEDDFKRDKLARDSALKEAEIESEFSVTIEDSRLKAQVEADRLAMDADLQRKQAALAEGARQEQAQQQAQAAVQQPPQQETPPA